MADFELSSEQRERVLQALDRANSQKLETQGKDEHPEKPTGKKKDKEWTGETGKSGKVERKPIKQSILDCIHVNETVLENKLVYFMLKAGSAGVIPWMSMYGLRWGLPHWHLGLLVGAGLLVASIFTPLWGFIADKLRWHRGMFWTVILLWMGFTIAAVYWPQPEVVPCEVVTSQLLDVLSVSCDDGHPVSDTSEAQERGFMECMGQCPIFLQTWPKPCTVDVMDVCTTYDLYLNTTDDEGLVSPTSNATEVPQEQTETSNASVTTEVPLDSRLRDTHLGWMFDKALQEQTSLIVFILAAVAGVLQISAFSLADASTLMALGEAQRDRYGWQRSFGTLGFALVSLLVVILLSESRVPAALCGITWEATDYFVGIVVFAGFMTIGVLVSSCLRFEHNDMSSQHSVVSVTEAIFSSKYGSVYVTAFFLSFCNGALTTFLNWHLQELGATTSLLAAALGVHALADITTSYLTAYFIKRTGYHFPIITGIIGYCLVYLAYAFMYKPGWILLIEVIHGASYAITVNAMTSYLASSVSLVSQASVQGLLSGIYWGLGPAAGIALFSYLADVIHATLSFYVLALISLLYGLVFLIWSRHELPMIDKYLPGDYQPVSTGSVD